MNSSEDNSEITLGVLNAVEKNSRVTQRDVAKNVGIALGLTNAYLKRCIRKGLIKVQQVPANRYSYYLTPQGFAEKSRLTGEYLAQGFQFFRLAHNRLISILDTCQRRSWNNLALHGLTDLTEIAFLSTSNYDIQILGIIDKASALNEYGGVPIYSNIEDLPPVDAIIITDLGISREIVKILSKHFTTDRIFLPELVGTITLDKLEGSKN